ncbi:MAG: rhomboid family intramembrane serine protease, partial [Verrucomicrobiales bacterium]
LGDRDYMRAQSFGEADGRQGPSPVTIIIWINVAVFMLQYFFGVWMVPGEAIIGEGADASRQYQALYPDGGLSREAVLDGQIYRFVTYMFVHGSLFHILGNMLLVYFAGNRVLNILGTRHFLLIYLLGGVLGAGLQLLVGETYLIGASAGAFALLCAFATLMPEMELLMLLYFVIPVRLRAKYLALGLVAISVVLSLVNLIPGFDSNIAHLAHLGGAALGWYYVRALGYGGRTVGLVDFVKKRRGRRAMPTAPGRAPGWGRGDAPERIVDAKVVREDGPSTTEDVDRVLDKIIREGFQSLTRDERRILEKGSDHIGRRVNRR